jgi:hypothetical protein
MATYILLDPNEIVQQQQAMAAVAAAAANNNTNNNNNNFLTNPICNSNIPNKSSSSNDVSSIEYYFLFFLFRLYLLADCNDFYLNRMCMHTFIICLFG